MFPIGDDDSSRRTVPLVTYALIVLNVLFFFLEQGGGEKFIMQWAFVPSRFLANPFSDFLTLFTSMFMHAGWVHLGGKTASGTSSSSFSTFSAGFWQRFHSWCSAWDRTCRIWEPQERLRGCSALTFCCSRKEGSEYYRANESFKFPHWSSSGSGSFCSSLAASVPLPMLRRRGASPTWLTLVDLWQGLR
jgi:hypothetical protein